MTKETVARQFFRDFLENLGYHVECDQELEEEQRNEMLTDLFFYGHLAIKWNPDTKELMLKPSKLMKVTLHSCWKNWNMHTRKELVTRFIEHGIFG